MSGSTYIHGTTPEEQRRLSRMNDLINRGSLRELALRGGEHILDLGSGLGQFTREMARVSGQKVIGVEYSSEQLEEAQRLAREAGEETIVEFRQGDALQPPIRDDEWGSFDVAHTRFLLEHLRDPLTAVRVMVRAVRPGGRVILEDDDHDVMRLWPELPGFESLWRAYIRTYDRLGNDPFIGRRLVSLLHQAGASPVRNAWVFFASCSGHPDFEPLVDNLITILEVARDAILATAHLEESVFTAAVQSMREWRSRPDAAIWFAICWAEARKPG
ncbi:MAG TPA: methyltransferase domain-containing protein [Acidobacteriota bacterium]|nr:methyltransferase domain-containing protein [Acidobacteriota bacterium]